MDPNEIVTLTKQGTGEIREVKRSELPKYNLPIDYQSQADVYAKSVATGSRALKDIPSEIGAAVDRSLQRQNYMTLPNTPGETPGIVKQGTAAVAQVLKQGGQNLLNQVKDKDSRIALSEEILRMGGVKEYRKQLPLDSLLNDTERTSVNSATDMLFQVDRAIPLFAKNQLGGTGPLAQFVPGFAAGEPTRAMRRSVEQIKALYAQMISGKVISDREMQRLERFLPSSNKIEKQNAEDLNTLKTGIMANLELLQIAKQEGLTANQAYEKYGDDILGKYGIPTTTERTMKEQDIDLLMRTTTQ